MPSQVVSSHRVAIVVDREFGPALSALASRYHVWVVESPTNSPFVREEWEQQSSDSDTDPMGLGVTSFEAAAEEPAEAMCERIADDVEDHHGEFGHDPPWSEIRVVGVSLGPRLEEVFGDFGVVEFVRTPDGFVCRRHLTADGVEPR